MTSNWQAGPVKQDYRENIRLQLKAGIYTVVFETAESIVARRLLVK